MRSATDSHEAMPSLFTFIDQLVQKIHCREGEAFIIKIFITNFMRTKKKHTNITLRSIFENCCTGYGKKARKSP